MLLQWVLTFFVLFCLSSAFSLAVGAMIGDSCRMALGGTFVSSLAVLVLLAALGDPMVKISDGSDPAKLKCVDVRCCCSCMCDCGDPNEQ